MNDNSDDQFDALIRGMLRSGPTPNPISNLSERAMSIARWRQAAKSPQADRLRSRHGRINAFCTAIAMMVIAGILFAGSWLIFARDISISVSSISASSSEQTEGVGFVIIILAGVVVILGLAVRLFFDSIDWQVAPIARHA